MPASPVCRDTLVSATVGAALNLFNTYPIEGLPASARTVGLVVRTALTGLTSVDIEHPLLLS
jgi:hypothetical protein